MDPFDFLTNWTADLIAVDALDSADASGSCSSSSLRSRIESRSYQIGTLGVAPGARVALIKNGSIDFFVDLAALWICRAVVFVIDPLLKPSEMAPVVQAARPTYILDSNGDHKIESSPSPTDIDQTLTMPDDACLALFTSGSSAKPKVVLHTAYSLRARVLSILNAVDVDHRAVTLNFLPVHFGHGLIGNCLTQLILGGRLALAPRLSIQNAHRATDWINASEASFLSGTPTSWKVITSMNHPPKVGLLRAQCASAHASSTLFESIGRWTGAATWNVYGLTEAASWISDSPVRAPGDERRIGDGSKWETGFRVDSNSGELSIRTEGLFSNYMGLSAQESGIESGWFKTGDIAVTTEGRSIRLVGRTSRQINRGGIKVSPEEVEAALIEHPEVTDAVVVPHKRFSGTMDDELTVIGALICSNEPLRSEALRDFLSSRLSDYKIPTIWRFVSTLPRLSNGKTDLVRAQALWDSSAL